MGFFSNIFTSKPDYSKIRTKKHKKEEKPQKPWVKWVKFGVVTFLYLLFLLWLKSWLGLIVVPFIYDAYITKKIKWTWWKQLESPVARTLMSWVDAIVFALVAVYFVHNFFFQNYQIPSSSLEKTLLTGDFLLVSKLSYGPRIPQTPLTLPLTQHTIPGLNCKSYIEWPHWDYRRAPGFGKVEQGDIVVFNYPAGDTVAVNFPYDLYAHCYERGLDELRQQGVELPNLKELSTEKQMQMYSTIYGLGKSYVESHEEEYGRLITRPVDRRENYVKRCVGLPGQKLQIKDKVIHVDGKPLDQPELVQFNYYVYLKKGADLSDELCAELGISDEDRVHRMDRPNTANNAGMPLTYQAKAKLEQMPNLVDSIVEIKDGEFGHVYPLDHEYGWTRDNYGPVWIPAKGKTLKLNLYNIALYERPIRAYEGNTLEVKDGKIFINGKETTSYTFKMDYYWMMGDNRHNSADSRYWGFVPEDHIVGKPILIWLSISPDKNPESSGIRWSRLFKNVSKIK